MVRDQKQGYLKLFMHMVNVEDIMMHALKK